MPNYNISTEVCKKGAAKSKAVQQEKAERRWEAAKLCCLFCNKPIERIPGLQACIQMKRKYCNGVCSAKHRWQKWRQLTGKAKPVHEPARSTVPFKTKAECSPYMVRIHSKKVFRSRYPDAGCECCGYSVAPVDVAHIRPISDFPDSATLLEINQITNLLGLCKNCHNEFDLGLKPEGFVEKIMAARSEGK